MPGRLRWNRAQVANLRGKPALGPVTDAQLLDVAERCLSADAMLQAALQQLGARITFFESALYRRSHLQRADHRQAERSL